METSFHSIEIYVEDLTTALQAYCSGLGFRIVAVSGPFMGVQDRHSCLLQAGDALIILSAPSSDESSFVRHWLRRHGEGVATITIGVAGQTASPLPELREGPGSLTHRVVHVPPGEKIRLPNFLYLESAEQAGNLKDSSSSISSIDHLAIALHPGELTYWEEIYKQSFDLHRVFTLDYAAAGPDMSAVALSSRGGDFLLVLLEPGTEIRENQLHSFLKGHQGAGVQHLAFQTASIRASAMGLRDAGLDTLQIPPKYYHLLARQPRAITTPYPMQLLSDLNVVVDADEQGSIMQFFTEDLHQAAPFFIEVIERNEGSKSFGQNNIAILFKAREEDGCSSIR
jgi:4-hydroxymandelate synthase